MEYAWVGSNAGCSGNSVDDDLYREKVGNPETVGGVTTNIRSDRVPRGNDSYLVLIAAAFFVSSFREFATLACVGRAGHLVMSVAVSSVMVSSLTVILNLN